MQSLNIQIIPDKSSAAILKHTLMDIEYLDIFQFVTLVSDTVYSIPDLSDITTINSYEESILNIALSRLFIERDSNTQNATCIDELSNFLDDSKTNHAIFNEMSFCEHILSLLARQTLRQARPQYKDTILNVSFTPGIQKHVITLVEALENVCPHRINIITESKKLSRRKKPTCFLGTLEEQISSVAQYCASKSIDTEASYAIIYSGTPDSETLLKSKLNQIFLYESLDAGLFGYANNFTLRLNELPVLSALINSILLLVGCNLPLERIATSFSCNFIGLFNDAPTSDLVKSISHLDPAKPYSLKSLEKEFQISGKKDLSKAIRDIKNAYCKESALLSDALKCLKIELHLIPGKFNLSQYKSCKSLCRNLERIFVDTHLDSELASRLAISSLLMISNEEQLQHFKIGNPYSNLKVTHLSEASLLRCDNLFIIDADKIPTASLKEIERSTDATITLCISNKSSNQSYFKNFKENKLKISDADNWSFSDLKREVSAIELRNQCCNRLSNLYVDNEPLMHNSAIASLHNPLPGGLEQIAAHIIDPEKAWLEFDVSLHSKSSKNHFDNIKQDLSNYFSTSSTINQAAYFESRCKSRHFSTSANNLFKQLDGSRIIARDTMKSFQLTSQIQLISTTPCIIKKCSGEKAAIYMFNNYFRDQASLISSLVYEQCSDLIFDEIYIITMEKAYQLDTRQVIDAATTRSNIKAPSTKETYLNLVKKIGLYFAGQSASEVSI